MDISNAFYKNISFTNIAHYTCTVVEDVLVDDESAFLSGKGHFLFSFPTSIFLPRLHLTSSGLRVNPQNLMSHSQS